MIRDPNRSTSTPTGICMPAYVSSCTTANSDSTAAVTPNRSVASSAATASEVRWKTATAYAATATPHTAQDRLVTGRCPEVHCRHRAILCPRRSGGR